MEVPNKLFLCHHAVSDLSFIQFLAMYHRLEYGIRGHCVLAVHSGQIPDKFHEVSQRCYDLPALSQGMRRVCASDAMTCQCFFLGS